MLSVIYERCDLMSPLFVSLLLSVSLRSDIGAEGLSCLFQEIQTSQVLVSEKKRSACFRAPKNLSILAGRVNYLSQGRRLLPTTFPGRHNYSPQDWQLILVSYLETMYFFPMCLCVSLSALNRCFIERHCFFVRTRHFDT